MPQSTSGVRLRRTEKEELHKLADAKIFLSDCLACDSCVTAEEGVQVSQQNTKDFFRVLNLNKKGDGSVREIVQIIQQNDLASNTTTMDTLFGDVKEKEVRLHEGGSSNGYLARIFRNTAKELFQRGGPGLCRRCLSGRGQAQAEERHADRILLRQMESIYAAMPVWPPETSTHVQELYQEWLEGWGGGRLPPDSGSPAHHLAGPRAACQDTKW
ncbi:hypothetical protein QTO34_014216 [Cnephaeus nilssonii]|uniref:Iron hydrogenase small subunit domain-containing protein n=1 Tax=Cnephaeus nilssonii TaxID=3371016 RepID=A0AA40LTT4_CNENI|nr:hypothetical protein QTO34_014216 [Eptesicus nilssonii]